MGTLLEDLKEGGYKNNFYMRGPENYGSPSVVRIHRLYSSGKEVKAEIDYYFTTGQLHESSKHINLAEILDHVEISQDLLAKIREYNKRFVVDL